MPILTNYESNSHNNAYLELAAIATIQQYPADLQRWLVCVTVQTNSKECEQQAADLNWIISSDLWHYLTGNNSNVATLLLLERCLLPNIRLHPLTFPVVSVPLPSIVHAYQPCRWLAVPVTDWRVVGLRTVWWARGRWCMQAHLDQTVTLGRNAAELGCLWRISELVGCHAPGAAPMAISRLRVSHDALNIRHYTTNLELAVARSKNS